MVILDPDFGWHLQTGNIISLLGIPHSDPFSYTMPSFPFINHEWLYDFLLSKVFYWFGNYGLWILFIFFGLLILLTLWRKTYLTIINLIVITLAISVIEPTFAIAPRVVSWLLFSITLYTTLNKNVWNKYWWITPLILFFWANIHGSFVLGILILGIIFSTKSVVEHKFKIKEFLALFIGSISTLINPYGIRLWSLVLQTAGDMEQKTRIVEWQSTISSITRVPFLLFFVFSLLIVVLIKYLKQFEKEEIVLNIIFFILALFAFRNINYWVLTTLPLISKGIYFFYKDLIKIKKGQERLLKSFNYVFIGIVIISIVQYLISIYHITTSFNENHFYPKNALIYLNKNVPNGQIFAEYNWGGYLTWKFPQRKVFISGLMPVWKNPDSPETESKNAMEEYVGIMSGKIDYKPIFNKYKIETVLLSNMWPASSNFRDKLENDGWKTVYKDSVSTVYQTPLLILPL